MITRHLLFTFVLFAASFLPLSAQVLVSVDKVITQDATLASIQKHSLNSKTVNVSGQAVFFSKSGYVRLLLSDDYGYDLLIYESTPLVAVEGVDNFSNMSMETIDIPSNLALTKVRVEIKNAELKNLSVDRSNTRMDKTQQEKLKTGRIALISRNLRAQNALWVAGKTSVSEMSYQEKKSLFGGKVPDLQGFEYYVGGIFEWHDDSIIDSPKNVQSKTGSPYVSSFDWRNRHGANDHYHPLSPYYNGVTGWMTSIKDQICGNCWAYGAVGPLEAIVNLYYNQIINVDLSEQELTSCDTSNSGCASGLSRKALHYIKNNGIIDELAFPSINGGVVSCSRKPTTSNQKITIADVDTTRPTSFEQIKKDVIAAPLAIGFSTWSHSLTLAGYRVLQAGDVIFLKDDIAGSESSVTIGSNDPRIGETALLLKNSWGSSWGDGGFGYLITNISNINDYAKIILPVTSLNYTNANIACRDRDGDGYYYWGIGPKPASCPCLAPDEPDGDDSNPNLGPMDDYGHCMEISSLAVGSPQISGSNRICNTVQETYQVAHLLRSATITWSSTPNIVINSSTGVAACNPSVSGIIQTGTITASVQEPNCPNPTILTKTVSVGTRPKHTGILAFITRKLSLFRPAPSRT